MLTLEQYTRAVSAAQGYLKTIEPNLSIDGIWGSYTKKVYDRLSGGEASRVMAVMSAAAGVTVSEKSLDEYRTAGRTAGSAVLATFTGAKSMNTDELKRFITGVALEEGVPPEAAIRFATVESKLNPNAVSATGAAGLFQLTGPAIKDVGIAPPGGNRLDIPWNVRVGVKYMKKVARYLGTDFGNVDLIYAGYNLGVGNVKRILKGEYNHPDVTDALSKQAKQLQQGGAKQYLANVKKFVGVTSVA